MAESELNGSIVESKTYCKKLTRYRGWHKGAFKKSEPKNDLMSSRSIVNEEQFSETEALFAN